MRYTGWNITAFDDKGQEHIITDVPKFVAHAVDEYLQELEEDWIENRIEEIHAEIGYYRKLEAVASLSKGQLLDWLALEDELNKLEGGEEE
jgi:hypothetical protein